jgi:thiol-disulfide isomerase/thioredoxin
MAEIREQYEKLLNYQKILAELDEEYTIKSVNGNYNLSSRLFNHKTFRKATYTTEELQFIRSVKSHVVNNEIYLNPEFQEVQLFTRDVKYVQVAKLPKGTIFDDGGEIDIDQAYWETAHILNIIDDEIYSKGKKGVISKMCRLTALGSLARQVYYYKFKGDRLIETIIDRDPLLQNLWFTICKRVADTMQEAVKALGKDFIFYWVDGVYFKNTPENVDRVTKIFSNKGYESRLKEIPKINFHEKGFTVHDDNKDQKREFTYPHYDTGGKKINYAENFKLAGMANKIISTDFDLLGEIKKKYAA